MRPLQGITVVTLEHAIAAPFCSRQLADLGARVIKIERPGVGDFARGYDQRVKGLASHFVWTNRSKESLTLDVKHPQAAELLTRLIVEQADVVVQNLAPGAAARLGVSYEALKDRRPDLIVCDISGYGDDPHQPGPYRDKNAYDLLIQSEAGFVSVTGTPDEPCKAGVSSAASVSDEVFWPGMVSTIRAGSSQHQMPYAPLKSNLLRYAQPATKERAAQGHATRRAPPVAHLRAAIPHR